MKNILSDEEVERGWEPLSIDQIAALLNPLDIFWCIAGGWAIELFVGESYRSHEDIDVLVFKKDLVKIRESLGDWDLFLCDPPGKLRSWEKLEPTFEGITQGWGRPTPSSLWGFDMLFVDSTEDSIVYKRDASIHFPIEKSVSYTSSGIPYLAPEVQLLHKAKSLRDKDYVDLEKCLPLMNLEQKRWLEKMITRCYGNDHEWLKLFRI